jgi:hypothetical protein
MKAKPRAQLPLFMAPIDGSPGTTQSSLSLAIKSSRLFVVRCRNRIDFSFLCIHYFIIVPCWYDRFCWLRSSHSLSIQIKIPIWWILRYLRMILNLYLPEFTPIWIVTNGLYFLLNFLNWSLNIVDQLIQIDKFFCSKVLLQPSLMEIGSTR